MAAMTVRTLSIDGGGVRGIIPALILREIESRLKKLNKARPFPELFQLIAGTSAGGVIALGLALSKGPESNTGEYLGTPALSTETIVDLFAEGGPEIFPPPRPISRRPTSVRSPKMGIGTA